MFVACRSVHHRRGIQRAERRWSVKHTVVGLFDSAEHAQQAAQALQARGFDASAVHVTRGREPAGAEAGEAEVPPAAEIESGPLSGLMHRLSALFDVEEPHLTHYEEAVRRGGTVVQADAADETQAATARDTLLAAGAVNLDDRVEEWQRAGWGESGAEPAAEAMPTSRGPAVLVHRREVSLGGVRVYGHVTVLAFDELADEFRADCEARYAGPAESYAEFEPAYRYGHALAADARFGGRSWEEIEADARAEWERSHPQSAWQRFKGAVRHAWERAMQR
jgi:hypothetical protein